MEKGGVILRPQQREACEHRDRRLHQNNGQRREKEWKEIHKGKSKLKLDNCRCIAVGNSMGKV